MYLFYCITNFAANVIYKKIVMLNLFLLIDSKSMTYHMKSTTESQPA